MKKTISIAVVLTALLACGSDDETKDMTYPVISGEGVTENPVDCQTYRRGDVLPVCFAFTDDTELGNYNIEVHSNHDHHSHSTSATECEEDHDHEHADAVNPWVFNQDYAIPAGLRAYTATHEIAIPSDIDPGDYHFMVRLTDRAGWQSLKAVAIRIE
ncbi:MAG: DUF4625 domain-containing protein [Bacteroidaceae bacterium]|nr:DUF4625 domain-containing protein [Bacteroidaceae bacterium]